jgi:hypothetical protein
MSKLAQLLETDFVPGAPAADTSAFGGPPATPTPEAAVDRGFGDPFVEEIAEQVFNHLALGDNPDDIDTVVDAFLAQLREQLVTG